MLTRFDWIYQSRRWLWTGDAGKVVVWAGSGSVGHKVNMVWILLRGRAKEARQHRLGYMMLLVLEGSDSV